MDSPRLSTFPSKTAISSFVRKMAVSLFPQIEGCVDVPYIIDELKVDLKKLLIPMSDRLPDDEESIIEKFFGGLPLVKRHLEGDAMLIFQNDPASTSVDEVILTYPGFYAIVVYRIAHSLASLDVPLIPRIMTEYAHSITGIDIHPNASIESPFFIDHGTGIVIGATSIIGKNVQLYQGVTIGALSVKKEMSEVKRHPTIEDNVIVYAGSTILGGETTIGHDSIIGGNVWLTESVPAYSLVYHQNIMKIRPKS